MERESKSLPGRKPAAFEGSGTPPPPPSETLFAGLLGLLLGLGLLKFGNPVILDHLVEWPRNWDEWRAFAWPLRVGYVGLLLAALAGIRVIGFRWKPQAPPWIAGLLFSWLIWQVAAAVPSIDPPLTRVVLLHFTGCTVSWLLGNLALSRVREPRVFWLCLVLGFVGVLGMAADQHWGGLEATRKMVLERAGGTPLSPEYLARIQSNRVFSTLVYPNALAGAVLLVLPWAAVLAWRFGERWGTPGARMAGLAMLVAGGMVLKWSGSKAGWLLALAAGFLVLLLSPLHRRWKISLAAALLVFGLIGFGALYGERLRRGATSVAARFDYWHAAVHGFRQRPLLGNGPGSFKKVYSHVKRPESEMAQLAHNDYLQQAADSGAPGFVFYLAFIVGSLAYAFRQSRTHGDPLLLAVWLGLATWFAQGLVEFGLYIPATAWTAFALLGWLTAVPGWPSAGACAAACNDPAPPIPSRRSALRHAATQ